MSTVYKTTNVFFRTADVVEVRKHASAGLEVFFRYRRDPAMYYFPDAKARDAEFERLCDTLSQPFQ